MQAEQNHGLVWAKLRRCVLERPQIRHSTAVEWKWKKQSKVTRRTGLVWFPGMSLPTVPWSCLDFSALNFCQQFAPTQLQTCFLSSVRCKTYSSSCFRQETSLTNDLDVTFRRINRILSLQKAFLQHTICWTLRAKRQVTCSLLPLWRRTLYEYVLNHKTYPL